jgi:hypothetical protein
MFSGLPVTEENLDPPKQRNSLLSMDKECGSSNYTKKKTGG